LKIIQNYGELGRETHLPGRLLFQQVELHGMHAAAFIAILTGSFLLFFGTAGRMFRRPGRTMTDNKEIGRKNGQQQ
jgi:hypothetical protein